MAVDFVVGAVGPVGASGAHPVGDSGTVDMRRWAVPVAESVVAPPGPIPNPVVTRDSAGEYCMGNCVGGEAAAGTSHRQTTTGTTQTRSA